MKSRLPGRLLGIAALFALAVAGYAIGGSSTDVREGAIDRQAVAWAESRSTSSPFFTSLPAPSGLVVRARGPISVAMSGSFGGDPVELRYRVGNRIFRPGPLLIDPSTSPITSFNFVTRGPRRARCQTIRAEWRVPGGGSATVTGLTATVQYDRQSTRRSACS